MLIKVFKLLCYLTLSYMGINPKQFNGVNAILNINDLCNYVEPRGKNNVG